MSGVVLSLSGESLQDLNSPIQSDSARREKRSEGVS